MRLHRFYVPELVGKKTEIQVESLELVNQLSKVFRLKVGDSIIIFDGSGSDYLCNVKLLEKKSVSLVVEKSYASQSALDRKIILYAAVVKKDNFEWIVEKATELGVSRIVPIISERSEKKSLNMERLKKISIEASEQSGRSDVPVIAETILFAEVAPQQIKTKRIVFHTEGDPLSQSDVGKCEDVEVFIGPEGGWSPAEVDMFHKNGTLIRKLGNQVLRSETAVVAALSSMIFKTF